MLSGESLGVSIMKQPKLNNLKVDVKGTKALRKLVEKTKKIKITINVDEDILMELRNIAMDTGVPYQSLLNKMLKQAMTKRNSEDSRLDRLEREVERLKKKISA